MKSYDLADKEFKVTVLRKQRATKKHRRQFAVIRKKIHEQNEKSSNETETLKKNQTEILELKKSMIEMKNAIQRICSRVDQMEDKISDLEDSGYQITQSEANREKK